MSLPSARSFNGYRGVQSIVQMPRSFNRFSSSTIMMAANGEKCPDCKCDPVNLKSDFSKLNVNKGVTLKSFKGYLANKDFAKDILAPAYDTLNTKEAKKMANGNPKSFLYVNKPEIAMAND